MVEAWNIIIGVFIVLVAFWTVKNLAKGAADGWNETRHGRRRDFE